MAEEKEDDLVLGEESRDERLDIIANQADLISYLMNADIGQLPALKDEIATVVSKALKVIHRVQCHLMEAYPKVKGQSDL